MNKNIPDMVDKFKDWAKRQIKELPHSFTQYIVPFIKEEILDLTPDKKVGRNGKLYEWMQKNPMKENEAFNKYVARGYYNIMLSTEGVKDYYSYYLMRTKNRLLNKTWFDQLKMSGAITTTSTGTKSLFNNKSIKGRCKCGKSKERCKCN